MNELINDNDDIFEKQEIGKKKIYVGQRRGST
jgi:hypothetical protein